MNANDEVELVPYGGFRDSDFSEIVTDMGVKEYGEQKYRKAYIEFKEGAPITYFLLDQDGLPVFKDTESGNIKQFTDLGKFAEVCQKSGLKVFIGINSKTFRTEPSLIGMNTHWQVKINKVTKGGESKEYTNILLKKIDVNPSATPQATPEIAAPETPEPTGITPEQVGEWQDIYMEVLDAPMKEVQIWTAMKAKVPDVDDTHPNGGKHTELGNIRKIALDASVKSGFLSVDEDNKYEIVM